MTQDNRRDSLVCKRPVRDPLFRTVNDPILPIFALLRGGLQAHNVAPGKRLRDG